MQSKHQDRDQEEAPSFQPIQFHNARKLLLTESTWNRLYVSQEQFEACQRLYAVTLSRLIQSKALLANRPSASSSSKETSPNPRSPDS